MTRTLHTSAIAFIILSSLLWTWHVVSFVRNASPRAKAACYAVGASFWTSPNAYYWCLDRVEAGGKP